MKQDPTKRGLMKRQVFGAVLLLVVAASGCAVLGEEEVDTDEALARWQAASLTDYEVEQRRVFICHVCDGGTREQFARVVVRGGEVAEVYDAEGALLIGGEINPTTPLEEYALTVDEVFEQIRLAEARENGRLDVSYDASLGYPRRFYAESNNGGVQEEILLRRLKPL